MKMIVIFFILPEGIHPLTVNPVFCYSGLIVLYDGVLLNVLCEILKWCFVVFFHFIHFGRPGVRIKALLKSVAWHKLAFA